jgi:O-antigen biosynthesis protein
LDEKQGLQTKINQLENELRELRDTQYRTLRMMDQLTAELEAQRLAQLKLKKSYANFDERLTNTTRLAESMEQSKIWQTLKSSAGTMLHWSAKLRGQPPPPKITVAPTTPRPKHRIEKKKSNKPRESRASATRHSAGRLGPDSWKSLLTSLVRTRSQPTLDLPRVSILTPTFNTKVEWFAEAAVSVLEQTSAEWEWIIVDDASTDREFHQLFDILEQTPRIKVIRLQQNLNISGATNRALELATGEFICCFDHDDLLHPTALAQCLDALEKQKLDAIYTDSDKVDSFGMRSEPFHKPAWSLEYFRGVMYVGHLLCVRTDLARKVGGFRTEFDKIQDYEFFLRVSENTKSIGHLPEVLYHWRVVPGSIASTQDAKGSIETLQVGAVQQHLQRVGFPGVAQPGTQAHRVSVVPHSALPSPLISIVIPSKDAADVLSECLSTIYSHSTYRNFEVIIADNGTTQPAALKLFQQHPVKVVDCAGKFNYSRSNNLGVAASKGDFILFLNNDIEVVTPNWLQEMLLYAQQSDVGAVGAKLLYPDSTIQHAGVILGMRGTADHVARFAAADSDGYFGSLSTAHEVTAVTAACLLMKRHDFDRIGGFNEHYFTAYQDVDLCLELRRLGLRNIFTPRAVLIHHESKTRGKFYDHVDRHLLLDRFESEIEAGDPYYNRNFELETGDYRLAE